MGYIEKIMGDNEQVIYRTHQHAIVLLKRTAGWLFAFLVFVALAIVILAVKNDDVRFWGGVTALISLIVPVYAIVRGWKRGQEHGNVLKQVWGPILAGVLILAVALALMFKPAVKVTWYDGGKLPPRPAEMEASRQLGDNGICFVGEKGTILAGGWAGTPRLVPESRMKDFQMPDRTIPRSIGHHAEWIKACKEGKPEDAKAGFAYSGPYTEALLVGNLALRLQKRIEWDPAAMRATNAPEAEPLIRKKYREGFGI